MKIKPNRFHVLVNTAKRCAKQFTTLKPPVYIMISTADTKVVHAVIVYLAQKAWSLLPQLKKQIQKQESRIMNKTAVQIHKDSQ